MAEMLDVSYWQGKVPQSAFAAMTGIDRVVLRASRADTALQQDSTYSSTIAAARATGKKVGHYHFNGRIASVADQAKFFCDNVSFQKDDVLVVDVESTGVVRFSAAETLQFLSYVESRFPGADLWVYMSASVTREEDWTAVAAKYQLWVAAYQSSAPTISYWKNYVAWQYTSSGKVPGISGNVDLSRYSEKPTDNQEGGSPMANLVNHPGMWLRDDAAASLARFERDHGKQPITSAGRTTHEQQLLIDRWNRGGAANRPPYLYQPAPISGPGASRHLGGIAIDTSNPSVFHTYGAAYGWLFLFAYDKVHFEYNPSRDTKKGSGTPGSSGFKFNQVVKDRQAWMISQGYDLGPTGADGLDGPANKAATKKYQQFLKDHWGYKGQIDGSWGGGTQAAHQRYYDSKKKPAAKPQPSKPAAPKAPAFPLPKGSYFGPRSGPAQSVSGYFSHRADLKKWQQRMKDRGWTITVDGLYGDGTARVAKAFQKQLGITQDGLIGATTWAKAWTAPVT